jgi:hypothetical protein
MKNYRNILIVLAGFIFTGCQNRMNVNVSDTNLWTISSNVNHNSQRPKDKFYNNFQYVAHPKGNDIRTISITKNTNGKWEPVKRFYENPNTLGNEVIWFDTKTKQVGLATTAPSNYIVCNNRNQLNRIAFGYSLCNSEFAEIKRDLGILFTPIIAGLGGYVEGFGLNIEKFKTAMKDLDFEIIAKISEQNKLGSDAIAEQENRIEHNRQRVETELFIKQLDIWRKQLKIGDSTHCGLVIDVKLPIAQIQLRTGATFWAQIQNLYPSEYRLACYTR